MSDEKIPIPLQDVEKEAVRLQSVGHAPDKVLQHANDADEAMKAFVGHEGEILVLDEATSKRLLRTIDWHLMPVRSPMVFSPNSSEFKLISGSCYASSMASTSSTVNHDTLTTDVKRADDDTRDDPVLRKHHGLAGRLETHG